MEKSNDNDLEKISNIKKTYEAGCLALYRKITEEQMDIFIKQLSDNISYKFDILRNLIDDDVKLLMIIDIFSGESISFPNRKQTFQCLDRTFMYTYARSRGFTEEAYSSISKHFGEKLAVVKDRVMRISQLLDGAEYQSLIKAQTKLKAERKKKREENKLRKEQEELSKNDM